MSKTRAALIGCGGMAQYHLDRMLQQQDTTEIITLCDPNPQALSASTQKFIKLGLAPPATWQSFESLLADIGSELDAAFIITPHSVHHDQTIACLETGLDVLLEKPMAVNASEALSMIQTRDRTERLLVIAFQGSLSPEVRLAADILRSDELGSILTINAMTWQGWKDFAAGTWRQQPSQSGGGFLFDTGAHMLNTVADLAGEPFVEVAAWTDPQGTPVDILGVAMARLKSGALVTFNACGNTIKGCSSDIRVFCQQGILQTDMWGHYLNIQRPGESQLQPVACPPSLGVWQQFIAVRQGEIPNPSPPEIGLRMIRLWDALHASAQQQGRPVACDVG